MIGYQSTYENKYGEEWIFKYDYENDAASLTGSDVDYKEYPVYSGLALELVLDVEEQQWLAETWETTKDLRNIVYLGKDTVFTRNNGHCALTNNYCPICLERKHEFEIHHCIPSKNGGLDKHYNLLQICSTCHAIITRGCQEDRIPKSLSAFYHQCMHFGMVVFPKQDSRREQEGYEAFLEAHPIFRDVFTGLSEMSIGEQMKYERLVKNWGLYWYQFFRDVARGIWPWEDVTAKYGR